MLKKIKNQSTKLVNKVKRTPEELPLRITNENVSEHREQILAGGRKFKYPLQYAKHKLVYNTAIISLAAIVTLLVLGWWQMYIVQSSNTFYYNVSKVLPLPVAIVDGQAVPYRDYLMKYRSAVYYLENKEQVNLGSKDGKMQVDYIKQQSMDDAVADAYAMKMADKLGIKVSDSELNDYIKAQRQSVNGEVSEQAYKSVIADYYDWSLDDYNYAMRIKLTRQKVAYALDKNAATTRDQLANQVKASNDFKAIAENFNKDSSHKILYGDVGWVPKTNNDGGLSVAASKLDKGQVSSAITPTTGDGYYFVLLVDSNATHVNYKYLKIPLDSFNSEITNISSTKVKYLISMPKKDDKIE